MKIFKSKQTILKDKIHPDNLKLLDEDEIDSTYYLEKLLVWQKEYSWIEWQTFKYYVWCDLCKGWNESQCICYAR